MPYVPIRTIRVPLVSSTATVKRSGSGAKVRAYDPVAMDIARAIFEDRIEYGTKPYDTLTGASALILATEWNEFRRPNPERMAEQMVERVIFDGRNVLDAAELARHGFAYYGVGIPGPPPDGH